MSLISICGSFIMYFTFTWTISNTIYQYYYLKLQALLQKFEIYFLPFFLKFGIYLVFLLLSLINILQLFFQCSSKKTKKTKKAKFSTSKLKFFQLTLVSNGFIVAFILDELFYRIFLVLMSSCFLDLVLNIGIKYIKQLWKTVIGVCNVRFMEETGFN